MNQYLLDILGSKRKCIYDERKMSFECISSDIKLKNISTNNNFICKNKPTPKIIRNVSIATTRLCNLRCKYCYAVNNMDHNEIEANKMHKEEVIEFLTKYINVKDNDSPGIGFIGGEPLMNLNLLHDVSVWAKSYYKKPRCSLTTNGTLLLKKVSDISDVKDDCTVADWLFKNRFSIKISIDGPKKYHDKNRIYENGSGSFDVLTNVLETLKQKRHKLLPKFTYRCTTPFGEEGPQALRDKLKFLNDLINQGYGSSFFMASAVPNSLENCNIDLLTDQLKEQYIIASEWFLSTFYDKHTYNPIWPSVTNRPLETIVKRKRYTCSCGAGAGYITLGFDGIIYACHRLTGSELGTVKDGIDNTIRQHWINKGSDNCKDCSNCKFKFVCGGGCIQQAYICNESIDIPHSLSCKEFEIKMSTALKLYDTLGIDVCNRIINRYK
jgi:uncharacterized protein